MESPTGSSQYWLMTGSSPTGPFTFEQIDEKLNSGEIHQDVMSCRLGESDWRPVRDQFPFRSGGVANDWPTMERVPPPASKPAADDAVHRPSAASGKNRSTSKTQSPEQQMAGAAAGLIGVVLLVSLGVLPASCAKHLPVIGRHYATFCDDCNGEGRVSHNCRTCAGRGFFAGRRCLDCGGTGKVQNQCPFCAGSGRKPAK